MTSPWWVVFVCSRQGAPALVTTMLSFTDVVPRPPWWNLETTILSRPSWSGLHQHTSLLPRNCGLSDCIIIFFILSQTSLTSGDRHKNPPWGSQKQHLLILLLLIVCSDGPSQLHAGWDGSPVNVCRSVGCWDANNVTQCLCWGLFAPLILCLMRSRKCRALSCARGEVLAPRLVFLRFRTSGGRRERRRKRPWGPISSPGLRSEGRFCPGSPPLRNCPSWVDHSEAKLLASYWFKMRTVASLSLLGSHPHSLSLQNLFMGSDKGETFAYYYF